MVLTIMGDITRNGRGTVRWQTSAKRPPRGHDVWGSISAVRTWKRGARELGSVLAVRNRGAREC